MIKKMTSLLIATIMLLQIAITPQTVFAREDTRLPQGKYVKLGKIDANSFDAKTMNELNKVVARTRKPKPSKPGVSLFGYFDKGNEPKDENKHKYHGNVNVNFEVKGLDGKAFQWNEIFGVDSKGNPNPAKLIFTQIDDKTGNEISEKTLKVTKEGIYTWSDSQGNKTELPMFDNLNRPLTYEVRVSEEVSDHIKLLTTSIFGTEGSSPTFLPEKNGIIKFNLTLGLTLQQVASTKFVSEWNTGVEENARPNIKAKFEFDDSGDGLSPVTVELPKNNNDKKIIRDWYNDFDPDLVIPEYIYNAPTNVDIDKTTGLTFEEKDGVKTVQSGDHKFKYDFTYDVINGGKLTMTEIIPVTFDANGGKFASIKEENAKQEIVKEVDYGKDLEDEAENPKKDRETFKGWGIKDAQGTITPVTDDAFKNIKEAKTFYAIWDNNDIVAEELEVKESFKDKNVYVNDFIPTLETLKGQVKIKDANGIPQALTNDDKLEILDDSKNPIADADLKDKLYEKLKEDDATEVSRNVTLKAKVNLKNGTSKEVDIPIKVIKNIYEAKTLTEKPYYVPADYVKVTVDPTTKAVDPQRTVYYVNPNAKVVIPGKDPVGVKEAFTRWTMKADGASADKKGTEYKLAEKPRNEFKVATTITAQYETGKVNIEYVDEKGNEINAKYHIDGVDYPAEKFGKLGSPVKETDCPAQGPKFKGYIFSGRNAVDKTHYADPNGSNIPTITYRYNKKVTTEDKSNNETQYFPVIFDANGGKFESDTVTQKTVYVYFRESDPDIAGVTFADAKKEAGLDKEANLPTKDGFEFKEWHDKDKGGTKVDDAQVLKFKGWDSEYKPKGDTFYAHYEQASALITYLDLDGDPIADVYKLDDQEYPTEKGGKAGETIAKDVFTEDTAPKFTGYKFNRIELNPKDGKYSLDKKATIKIYYEKLPDVIPEKDGSGNSNEKPDGYVEVKFVPTDKAKDKTEKIFYVNPKKDVTIPIANPEAKATYTFKEWKMGEDAKGEKYTPSTAQKFTKPTTVITATYEETENIIPYDPSVPDPKVRPDGYVRVTFVAEKGLSLTESKAYYVKANAKVKLSEIKSDETKYGYPKYKEETGYKFDKWDKEDNLEIKDADIVVTANATKLGIVIPEKNTDGSKNDKPEGYKEVTFVIKDDDKDKGSIDGVAKFYVNPTEYVKINPPATTANTGYEFGTWDKDSTIPTVYKDDATITGSFNGLKDVIPKTNPDGTENKQPDGYKTVTFVIDPATGGKIADNEVTVYYVNPAKEVTVPQPKTQADTGYEFEKWDQDTTTAKKYTDDTTVKGNFKKLEDIIPSTNDEGKQNPKPEGYVTVTFDKGEDGKEITGQTVYYVNPKANKTIGELTKPKVTPETGWKLKLTGEKNTPSWDKLDSSTIDTDITVTAQFVKEQNVIPEINEDGSPNEKPDGYITVKFSTEKNGKITGTEKTEKVLYVNPNVAVKLDSDAPKVTPNTGFDFAGWDTQIDKKIQYEDGAVIKAQYNVKGDVIPQEKEDGSDKPASYLTVTFDKGDHGELGGKTVYYVKPNTEVTVPAPIVKPNVGFEFEKWDKELTQTFTKDTTIKAEYKTLKDIIPQEKTDGSDKPNGYVTVTFVKGDHGELSGQTVYYVNPKANPAKKLGDQTIVKPTVKAEIGYKFTGWDTEDAFEIKADKTVKAQYDTIADVVPKDNPTGGENKKPEGYVTVTLIPTNKATDQTKENRVFFVNPKAENVKITNKPEGKKETINGIEYTYVFNGWTVTKGTVASWTDENINGKFDRDTEITANYSKKAGLGELVPAPVAKKDVVTPKGDKPKPEDLITNIPGSEKDPLPKGTKITYEEEPKVDNPGDSKAKVKIEYPGGKTVVVEVPIKVVDNVVPQIGNDKPLVPESYVKVVVDTTDKAVENTRFVKTFWVKPNVEVTIPGIFAPNGKTEIIDGVTKKNNFVKWQLEGTTGKTYDKEIKDKFTATESKIVATYEQDKNVEPKGKNNQWIPQGSKPSPKDFIENPYNDDDPNNKDNLPPGTKIEFVKGKEPDTKTPGKDKETTIKITYPNGETKEVPVKYNVTGDVVEQKEGEDKPKVPENFVKVVVKTTDKATEDVTKTFWVNPTKEVTVPVTEPTGKTDQEVDLPNLGKKKVNYVFKEWQKVQTGQADDSLTDVTPATKIDLAKNQYTDKVTVIEAAYKKSIQAEPIVNPLKTTKLDTPKGKEITDEILKGKITPQEGKEIASIEVISKPDGKTVGDKQEAKVIVKYKDGTTQGTNENPVVIPVEIHENIIPAGPNGEKPEKALENYVKVIFKAGTGGKLDKTLTGNFVYYVSPEVTVDMTGEADKISKTPDTGYIVNGGEWKNKDNKDLKGTFTEAETVFEYNFKKSTDIVEKVDENTKKPDGYVTVTFRADDHGKLEGNKTEKIYYVNPKAGIKLVELAEGQKVGEKQLAVPKTVADENYVFEKWYEAIDKNNPVTNNLEYVARFVKNGVTLTYDANGAEGTVPEAVTVAQGTSVRLASAEGLKKKDATFAGWKLDGEDKIYQPGDQVKLEKARTATAQWTDDKNIIPYDPKEPITRPVGYVRVTFKAKNGLNLTEEKAYYVKKNAGVTLKELAKPGYSENVGYKFDKWDKENSLVINEDIVVTAEPTTIPDAIEVKTGVDKPKGYVEVKFVAGENGTVETKTYYVNPTKYVKLTPPTAKGKTGFEFGGWDNDATIPTVYDKNTTITASFNPVDSVIPKTEDDQQKPDEYVTVNFVIKGEGGQIVDGETITYFVNPNEEVTIPQPKTKSEIGYEFEAWDIDTTTKAKYTVDTTVTGKFRKLDDIIPSTDKNGKPNAKPEGYVTVTFDKGANGNLTGQTAYYVNPKAGKTLADIKKPTVTPETGYKFKSWDTEDSFAINANKTVIAKYEAIADVIPKTKDDDSEKPAGYIKVTFDTTEKGKIKGTTNTTKVVFVNPNKAVVLKGFAPEVVANKGHEFERWDTSIEKAIQYKNGDTIKAIYKDDTTPGGTTPGDKPGDEPGDNPGGTTPGDKPGDKPGDNPGGTTPGGTTPGTNPETPGENPETPGTVPENPGAIPGTKPGVVEKHGNRYVERVAGKNRVHTAISTSKRFFKKSKYVIIADSGNYPDALTATVLAHVLDAPILLNNTRYLEDDVAREIVRLGASEVIIVGGHKSISENVKSQLAKYDQNKVQRIWGRDRYVTSSELAYEIERLTGKVNKAIIASGENFPDALATAPLGSKEIAPILLVTRNQMDKKVSKALKDLNINKVYVAGGQNSVSKKLEAKLPQVIRRFSGQDRYETAILVASYTYPESKEVFVASGETFPDALVIGPVCARRKAPILLSKSTPVKVTDDYIEKSKIEYLYIIGGTNTIYADTAHKYAIED